MLDTNAPPDFDPTDPVHQTLQAMAAEGSLPQTAPVQGSLPPEGFVNLLMQNLVHNSRAARDEGMMNRAMAAVFDVLDAPRSAVQAYLGFTPEQQRAYLKANPFMPSAGDLLALASPQGMANRIAPRVAQGQSPLQLSPDMSNFAADMLLDPTTYIGLGLFKGAARGAAKVGIKGAPLGALDEMAKMDAAASEAMGKVATTVIELSQKGLLPVNKALAAKWPELTKWTDYYKTEQDMGLAVQWLTQKVGDLPTMRAYIQSQQGNMTNIMAQLPTDLAPKIDPQHLALVIGGVPQNLRAMKSYGAKAAKNPVTDPQVALEGYRLWLQDQMGLKGPQGAMRAYLDFADWWKKQALGSLNYLLQNFQGGAVAGQMVGVRADKTLDAAVDNASNIARGVPFNTAGAQEIARKTGVPIPYTLHEQADRALNAMGGAAGQNNPVRDSLALGILGGIGAGPAGVVAGAALGAKVGAISDRIRKSSQGIETVLRERGWEEGMTRELVKNMAAMERVVVDALTAPGARASGRPVHQNFIDIITKEIQDNGGQINPADLRRTLVNTVRITPDRADQIVADLDDILYAASQKGVGLSNKFNFDYTDLSALERTIANAFPFSVWLMKAAPFYAEQAARHPLIANVWKSTREESAAEQRERGLPGRFTGTLPMPGGSILSAILGHPVEPYADPLRGFMPFAGAQQAMARQQYEDPEKQTMIDHVYNALDTLGLSAAPGVDVALRTLGLLGQPDDPARGIYIRGAAPIAGASALASRAVELATGENPGWYVDINKGTQNIETWIREAIREQDVTDPIEVQTERRVDELALRETSKPIGSTDAAVAPYVTARRTHRGEIWERAKAEIELEKGVQALSGFVSQNAQPQAILTREEAAIRDVKKQALINPTVVRALDTAAERNPAAVADQKTLDMVIRAVETIAQRTGQPTPSVVEQRLASPTNANLSWISREVYKWEVEQNELVQGYGTGGTPEQRRIGNAVAGMSRAGQDLTPQQRVERIAANRMGAMAQGRKDMSGTGTIAAALAIPEQDRTTIEKTTPNLEEYLAWKKSNPSMDVADFLAQKFGK
jgi:hypothetical protein